ncbi:LysM peptidoglycan-binding domain-containing protein [Pediococcus pentosaceus]|uniref:LysM peptidoglycan-binding domain-containing protein n=2 Tax=Pediococcus TaxID=1253 RepID=UPI001E2DCC6A|nr:LysM peptidoglycan-binding domain-containing protein [Pediococcus pentosaceus]MCG7197945.1 LysM peptidoglycan-binding domain-containing protein [Pediococcus pentosaceus]MCI2397616.1 LysM peptidoglycan-binding domain-containing protein [Pediococcus pentosaceus]
MVTNSKSNASKLLLAGAAGAGLLVAGGTQVIAHADSVKVQKSDTVWALSQKYGVSVKSIESLNNINQNSHLIFVGQDINIPGKTDSKVTKITVKSGDSLSVLAEKYGVSVNAIMKVNNLSSSLIIVGQSLTIPAANGSASQASSTYVPQATQQATVQVSSAAAQTVVTPAPSSAATTYVAPASSAVTSQAVTSVAPSSAVSSAASSVAPSSSAVTSQAVTSVAPSSAVSSAASSVAPSSSAVTSQAATSVAPSSAVSSTASSVAPSSSAVTSQAATSVAPSSAVSSAASSVAPSSSAVTSQAVTSVAPSSAATTPSYATHTSSAATTTNTTNVASSAATTTNTTNVASSAASSSATTTTTQNTGSVTGLARSLANNTIPYVWGGKTTSGFDCSGFVSYVYQHSAGISLPSYTVAMESYVTKKSVSAAQPGDLLFWGSAGSTYHVAIYLGNNQYANAPTFGQNAKVSTISSYFYPSFAGSVR